MEYDPRKEPTVWGASSFPVLPWKSWRILQVIGSGNFGTVYESVKVGGAFDERSAIKHIPIPKNRGDIQEGMQQGLFSTDSGARQYYAKTKERIINEIRLMQRFSGHSHVVNYHDYEIVERQDMPGFDIFIRMELLQPLPEYLRGVDASDMETIIIRLGMDVCDALMALHHNKIIHRDIKPANILHGDTGFKLADFGVARSLEATGSMTVAGTLGYMSPEIYRHFDTVNHTSDLYTLGLVMYRLLNDNRMPFLPTSRDIVIDENMQTEAMGRRMKGEPLPAIPGVSPALMGIIIRACSFEAKDRHQKAGEMFEALEQLNRRPAVLPQAQLTVSKTGALTKAAGNREEAVAEAGDTITYTVTLKNTGNGTVTDVLLADSNHAAFQTMKALAIEAGETVEIGYPYLVTQDDIPKGDIENRITATGKCLSGMAVTATDEHTLRVTDARPRLTVTCLYHLRKAEGNHRAQAAENGDAVEYAVTVTNVGNIKVDQIRLSSKNQRMNEILEGTSFNLMPKEKWIGSFQQDVEDEDIASDALSQPITASGLSGYGSQVTANGACPVPVYSNEHGWRLLLIISIAAILVGLCLIIFFGLNKELFTQGSVYPTQPFELVTPVTTPPEVSPSGNNPILSQMPIVVTETLRYDGAEFGYWDDNNVFISGGTTAREDETAHQLLIRFSYTNISAETLKVDSISVCYQDENARVAISEEPWELTPGSQDQFTISVQGSGTYYLYVNGELIGSTQLTIASN